MYNIKYKYYKYYNALIYAAYQMSYEEVELVTYSS